MILLALALATAAAPPEQLLVGPAFETFARTTERLCPARSLRSITPGDLDFLQSDYVDGLDERARHRLVAADAGPVECAGRDGLACPTHALLAAMARTKHVRSFARYACAHRLPR